MEGEAVPPEARQSQIYKILFIYYTGFAGILEYMQNDIFIRPLNVKSPIGRFWGNQGFSNVAESDIKLTPSASDP